MQNKFLVVCGPTATGKTKLGILLAKKFNGEIVSADSRQVYKFMDIGTGKDIEKNSRTKEIKNSKLTFYEINGVKVFGYDLADPKDDFSISEYLKFSKKSLSYIYKDKKLPIIVGGTGFYIKGITDGIPTVDVPVNTDLRKLLELKNAGELFESLSQIDPIKAANMNSSDKKNPRRLIRAIEVAQYLIDHPQNVDRNSNSKQMDILFVGLYAPTDYLNNKINLRVDARVLMGMKDEVKKLLSLGVNWHNQSMQSLGYRQYRDFFEGGVDESNVTDEWKKEERKYAKRQMTWFKKDKRINWFDITDPQYQKKVEKLVLKWHNSR